LTSHTATYKITPFEIISLQCYRKKKTLFTIRPNLSIKKYGIYFTFA